MRVGILTTFNDFDTGYSLCSVVNDQLNMHVRKGYEVVLFVLESFRGEVPEGVEVRKVIPPIILEPYAGDKFPECWEEDAKRVSDALQEHCRDIDILIDHDWIFIDAYLPYNIGLRQAQLSAKHFHWIHSAPSPRKEFEDNPHANRYNPFPNSKIIYLNNDKPMAVAEMFGTTLNQVRVIHNSRDPRTFWNLDPFVNQMIDKYDLMSADIVSCYPLSSTRMVEGKQIDVAIRIHAELNKLGLDTRLIVPNAHANAEKEKHTVDQMIELAKSQGLEEHQILFTSKEGYDTGIPAHMVSDFFRISNVFIFPSISENCSLVLLEAMLAGNLLVLNKDCSGLQEFGGENAIYFKFGNIDMGTRNHEQALQKPSYLSDIARIIKSEYETNKVLKSQRKAFKEFNLDYIMSKIENLYYE